MGGVRRFCLVIIFAFIFEGMADILPRQKIVQQLVKISRQIPQDSSLPRIHYLLEPLLTGGEAEPDDLISIHETLERIFGDEESLSHLYWSLKSTSNESIAEKYLKDIYPSSPLSDDWNPDDPRVLLRFLITRIDMCPQFSSRDPSLYENYVSFIVQVYPELGHSSSFPHDDYAKRLNLYRLLEEKGFITPKSIEALTDILERLELKKLKAEIEEEFSLLLRDVDSLQLKKTLRYIQSKMHRKSTLPRVYYILESLLTEEVKRDSLLSMYQSLQMRDLNGTSPLWYLMWVLKVTQNERLANDYLCPLIPDPPPPPDWSPTIPPLLLRMIIVSIDASEALRDPKVFKSFVRSVSACDEYIGSLSNYPHDRVDLRMDLYRRLEERSVISTSNIEPLISILDSLGLKALQEKVVESFKRHLKGLSYKATVKKAIDAVVSELNCPRVLPRVYYLLECLLTEDAKSDDLYSMYISLSKRDLKDQDPLWYIAWSLSHTHNDALVRDHIHPLLVDNPVPDKWMPPNPMMMMRVVMVRMDLSEEFRKKETYINFIRVISPHDEYIGIHKAFPFDQQMERMNFYRRLENVKLITPEKIMVIIDGLRYIGEIGLMDRVSQDFRRFLFSHRQVTPTGYYSAAQLAHFDPSSPLYSMYSLDPALPPKEPPSLPPPPLTGGGTAPTSNGQLASSQRGVVPGGQQMPHPLRVTGATPLQREGGASVVPPRNDPPDYKSVVDEYRYHPPTTPDTMTGPSPLLLAPVIPSIEDRIWIDGESGEDVARLCIKKLIDSYIFPDDKCFMLRVAHVMSRFGNPPFTLHTDGGIWQVSLFAFVDNSDTRGHVRLPVKYEKISRCLGIDWSSVERRHLAIPMYSAVAARLYLSNFAESIPPAYKVEEQANYWWNIYMMRHESKHFMKKEDFYDTVKFLSGQ